jgi:N,N-dimethylformamidase
MTTDDLPTKELTGYTDQWSFQPGDTVPFMVNCDGPDEYEAEIVRVICGDLNPEGPGVKEEVIDAPVNGTFTGRKQVIHAGSYAKVPSDPHLELTGGLTLQAMVQPTLPEKGVQGILSKYDDETGYSLHLGEDGDLCLRLAGADGTVAEVSTDLAFEGGKRQGATWYFVGATFDPASGEVTLYQEPHPESQRKILHPIEEYEAVVTETVDVDAVATNDSPFIIGGEPMETDDGYVATNCYNGKIERPRVFSEPLELADMRSAIAGPIPTDVEDSLSAAWDFSEGITPDGVREYTTVVDTSPHENHGELINTPARGMTGYNWSEDEYNFTNEPDEYGAIHFHHDDLTDANWDVDFEYTLPDDMESAVYAARLRTENDETYIPFFVRPSGPEETESIAFLAPTASYLAYSNDHLTTDGVITEPLSGQVSVMREEDIFLSEHREYGLSLYDSHADGSGIMYSSRKRPILNMAPKYKHWLSSVPSTLWQFNADLHIIDWLEEMGYDYDVVTDEDLYEEGADVLEPYNVVLTGSHPEYYSSEMWDGVQSYQKQGGRLMYMGANGFYWSIAYHPQDSQIIEVRRGITGSGAWFNNPGEMRHSFTGEQGGIWRDRNKPPQKLAGVGWIAEGFDKSSYYRRKPDSYEPETEFIFDGIEDEVLGDFGLIGHGAAGLELDIYNEDLGTPKNSYLLASSEDHTPNYLRVVEEIFFDIPYYGGKEDPEARGDIVYCKLPNDGAIFSTSSIGFHGSLSHDEYDNNISKMIENVLDAFNTEEPLP